MDNQERDAEIALGYLQGATAAKLGRKYKLSVPQIRKILAEQKVTRKDVIVEAETSKAIDPMHVRLGLRIYNYRFKKGVATSIAAQLIGWSARKLRSIEQGQTVVSLMDLMEVARFMQTTPPELMRGLWDDN